MEGRDLLFAVTADAIQVVRVAWIHPVRFDGLSSAILAKHTRLRLATSKLPEVARQARLQAA